LSVKDIREYHRKNCHGRLPEPEETSKPAQTKTWSTPRSAALERKEINKALDENNNKSEFYCFA